MNTETVKKTWEAPALEILNIEETKLTLAGTHTDGTVISLS